MITVGPRSKLRKIMSEVIVQGAVGELQIPTATDFEAWVHTVNAHFDGDGREVTIRVVDEEEMAALNKTYRNKQGTTNVLSFPFENPPGVDAGILGDIVICSKVVSDEAVQQGKTSGSHWAHLVIHGMLHLHGLDHIEEDEAKDMESLEEPAEAEQS